MKKSLLIFALFFGYMMSVTAQKQKLDELFEKYQDTDGVTSIKIAKPMFGMLSKLDIKDSELDQIKPLLSKIQGLKMLIIEQGNKDSSKPATFYQNLGKEIMASVNNLNYQELMTVNSKDSKIKFLSSEAKDGILDNLLLNIKSNGNTVLMMLDGKISMDDVNNLVNQTQITVTNTTSTSTSGNTVIVESNSGNSGDTTIETRNVGQFTGIQASAGIKVNFTQAKNQKVTVETDPGMAQYIFTDVENGILKVYIKAKNKGNLRIRKALVTIEAPRLNKITTSSGASFATLNTIQEDNFEVAASSGSSLNAELNAKNSVNADINSGANLKIDVNSKYLVVTANSGSSSVFTGKADSASFDVSSAATVNAQNTIVKNVQASASSAGNVKVNSSESISTNTSSGGSVKFAGAPKNIKMDNSSGGSTKQIN